MRGGPYPTHRQTKGEALQAAPPSPLDPHGLCAFPLPEGTTPMPAKPKPEQQPTLDMLLNSRAGTPDEVLALCVWLASREGGASQLEDLRRHFSDEVIVSAVHLPPGTDKRQRPPARLGNVGGVHAVWLTTKGWERVGINRREQHPLAESLTHAHGPEALEAWIADHQHTWDSPNNPAAGPGQPAPTYRVRVSSSPKGMSEFTDDVASRAWVAIRGAAQDAAFGTVTTNAGKGGYKPDCIITEMVSPDIANALYNLDPITGQPLSYAPLVFPKDVNEVVTAVEVEKTRKGYERIGTKVTKAQAAIDLGTCSQVLWVVGSPAVWQDLIDLGVGHRAHHPRQRLVPAAWISDRLEGDHITTSHRDRIWNHFTLAYYAENPPPPEPRKR